MLDGNPEGRFQGIGEDNIKPLKTKINTNYI
jgi:hypothetical protein